MCWSDDAFSQTSAQLSPKEHHQASCCEELSYTRATRVFNLSFYPKCKPSSDSFSKTGGLKSLWQKKKRVEMCGGGILKGLLTKEFEARGGGGVWTTICADVSTVIILNSACYRQLPPVLHPDSWANTCQLLCHYHLYISQPPHLPLIKLVSSRLTGGLPIRPVPSLSIVRQSPSRFWRGKSRPEC